MSGDGAQKERVEVDRAAGIADDGDVKLHPDFATAPPLSRGERRFFQRVSNVLRFTDFMTAMMVMATFLSAYATWRTAQVTNLLFTVAERPYMGVEEVTVDSIDKEFARVVVDCRNFGQVQATNGVGRIAVTVDGKALPNENTAADTDNFGIVSPTVPHRIFRFVPKSLYEEVREGRSRMIVHIEFDYRGPDQRQFCYEKLFSYDSRSADFIPNGGNDRCDGEIY